MRGMRRGFRLGFDYVVSSCVKEKSNMKSALENEQVVDEYLGKKVALGRVIGRWSLGYYQWCRSTDLG